MPALSGLVKSRLSGLLAFLPSAPAAAAAAAAMIVVKAHRSHLDEVAAAGREALRARASSGPPLSPALSSFPRLDSERREITSQKYASEREGGPIANGRRTDGLESFGIYRGIYDRGPFWPSGATEN